MRRSRSAALLKPTTRFELLSETRAYLGTAVPPPPSPPAEYPDGDALPPPPEEDDEDPADDEVSPLEESVLPEPGRLTTGGCRGSGYTRVEPLTTRAGPESSIAPPAPGIATNPPICDQ